MVAGREAQALTRESDSLWEGSATDARRRSATRIAASTDAHTLATEESAQSETLTQGNSTRKNRRGLTNKREISHPDTDFRWTP